MTMNVYRILRGWRIFTAIGCPIMLAIFGYLFVFPLIHGRSDAGSIFLMLFGGGFFLLILVGLISTFTWRLEVYPDHIVERGILKNKIIEFDKIQGVRMIPSKYINFLVFIPKKSTEKKFKIPLMMNNAQKFGTWVDANFKNLTYEDYQKEEAEILQSEAYGSNQEDRIALLKKAKSWAKFIDILAIGLTLWALFYPRPYEIIIGALILFPLIVFISMRFFSGMLRFGDDNTQGIHPHILYPFLGPSLSLMIRVILDWNVVFLNDIWIPGIIVTMAILGFIMLIMPKIIKMKKIIVVTLIFISFIYGNSSIVILNGMFDNSVGTEYKTVILDKRISTGRRGTRLSYNVKLTPWGSRKEAKEAKVTKALYERAAIGDTVSVIVREGRFKIPWYYVR